MQGTQSVSLTVQNADREHQAQVMTMVGHLRHHDKMCASSLGESQSGLSVVHLLALKAMS